MTQQAPSPGNARMKRNSWSRGNGYYSMRGELKRGISKQKKELNRKVRHHKGELQGAEYKKIVSTARRVDFS